MLAILSLIMLKSQCNLFAFNNEKIFLFDPESHSS